MKNKEKIKLFILLTIFNFQFSIVNSQEEHLSAFVDNVISFNHLYPQEKVYLHFDNTGYYTGENIYFQSYVVVAETHASSALSGILHVELLDASGKIIEGIKLKIDNGRAPGGFYLKNDLPPGFYEVRAYTRSMLNFGDETVFSRVFPVFSRPRPPDEYSFQMPAIIAQPGRNELRKTPESLPRINLSFYPEGGYMVYGLNGRVAVKATNNRGESIEAGGTVYNSANEPVAFFNTLHNGMGFFYMRPDGGKYTVEVTSDNRTERIDLPEALAKGYAMQVTQRIDNISVNIAKTPDIAAETLGITLTCRGRIYTFTVVETGEREQFQLIISKEDLPSGVCQITMFNAEGNILAERLVFVDNKEGININPLKITASFAPLSPISIDFAVSDATGKPMQTSFSLSVRDRDTEAPSYYSDNIMTDLLLSSDLKGYIENPGWYFDENNLQRMQALDLLMMTQGWRRYPWETMSDKKTFDPPHYIEKNLIIDGTVLQPRRDRPVKNTNVIMWLYSMSEGASQRGECPTDDNGDFNLALDDFYGTWNLSLQTKEGNRRQQNRILLNRNFSPEPKIFEYRETQIPEKRDENNRETLLVQTPYTEIDIASDSIRRLEEVVVSARRRWRQEEEGMRWANVVYDVRTEVDRLRDRGSSEAGLFIDFLLTKPDFSHTEAFPHRIKIACAECTEETTYMATVTYKGKPVVFVVNNQLALFVSFFENSRDSDSTTAYNCGESFFGFYVINDLATDEIETVTIDEHSGTAFRYIPYCFVNKERYVLVHVYTNNDGFRRIDAQGIRTTRLQGFSLPVEFYSPDYSIMPIPQELDIRRTLYWNPDVTTNTDGKATVNFYNNDTCKAIRISAETVTSDGRTGVY